MFYLFSSWSVQMCKCLTISNDRVNKIKCGKFQVTIWTNLALQVFINFDGKPQKKITNKIVQETNLTCIQKKNFIN